MAIRTLGDVVRRSEPLVTVAPSDVIIALGTVVHEKRVDAVAVVRDGDFGDGFLGLVTSRDIAACVARRDSLNEITAEAIMTTSPITLMASSTPAHALSVMRSGRFRHIPVLEEENGHLVGIVDVLHLAYDAISRLQTSYDMIPSRRTFDLFRAARANIEKPTLRPIVEAAPLVTLNRNNTVIEACEAIVKNHLAAIVIVDEHGILDGIFTCRDVSTRVVAKHLDASTVTLEQVMTLNPDSASCDYTILESLQRMQACSYRHLPVVEDHSRKVVGLVNVLQLACDALLEANESSQAPPSCTPRSPVISKSTSSNRSSSGSASTNRSSVTTFFSSIFNTGTYAPPPPPPAKRKSIPPPSRSHDKRTFSNLSRREVMYGNPGGAAGNNITMSFVSFKFRDINDEFRKVRVASSVEPGGFNQLVIDIRRRFFGSSKSNAPIKIKYIDEEGDAVLIANDEDLAACLADAGQLGKKTVNLHVTSSGKTAANNNINNRMSSVQTSPPAFSLSNSNHMTPPSAVTTTATMSPDSSIASEPPPIPPTPSEVKAQTAHACMMGGDVEKAIGLFDEAIALDGKNARAMGGRGAARLISGNSTGAEEDYRSAIAMLDNRDAGDVTGNAIYEMCISGLVEALIDQRRYEEALSVASKTEAAPAVSRCVDAFVDEVETSAQAARAALEEANYSEAMGIYSNAVRVENAYLTLSPRGGARADLRVGRGKCYAKLEDYDMALEDYEAAVEIENESVAAIKGIARCLMEMEQPERALEKWERAHQLDSGDEEAQIEMEKLRKALRPEVDTTKTEDEKSTGEKDDNKKAEIAKLGAVLGNLKFGGKK